MTITEPTATADPTAGSEVRTSEAAEEIEADEVLVEEISIDGMCGVY